MLRAWEGSASRAALLVFLVALLVRGLAVTFVFEDRAYFSDETYYFKDASIMADGAWLGSNAQTAPGIPYLIATGMALGLDRTGLRWVLAVAGSAAALLTFLLGRHLFGAGVGFIAGLGTGFYPLLVYLSGVFYAQNAAIPLLLLVILALYRRQAGGAWGWLVAAAIGWGLGIQFMVPLVLTCPVLALWHVARVRPIRRGVVDTLILAGVTLLLLVPVTLRNYALEDRFVFVAAMGGRALYWANNPDIDPRDRDSQHWIDVNITRVEEERVRQGWTHSQVDSVLTARARAHIRAEPGRFLRNSVERAKQLWDPMPRPFTQGEHTSASRRMIAAASSLPVLLLAAAGALVFLPRIGLLFPLYAIPLILTIGVSAFHTTVRYRLTFEPLLLLLAAAVLVRWIRPSAIRGASGERRAPASEAP